MDGLNVKFSGSILQSSFYTDKYGSYIPRVDQLRNEKVAEKVIRQLRANTGLWKRMTEMYYKTDVEFTDNPEGNTPVLGAGIKLFGPRPMNNLKFRGRLENVYEPDKELEKKVAKRKDKIVHFGMELLELHKKLEPVDKDSQEYIMWLIEGDQLLTGGGFDNNKVGEVHKSALKFVSKAQKPLDYEDTDLSKLIVEESIKLRDWLVSQGMVLGSLKPDGASKVRFDQDKDGMIGFPVFGPANAELTHDIATRLLIWTGVDTRQFIGTSVIDINSNVEYKYRNIDALSHILDNSVYGTDDLHSVVTLLARIQKHGWILVDGTLEAKPGKTRSVYPNSAIEGMIEAMIASPFLRELQERKIDFMPSLQNKEVRVEMITKLLKSLVEEDYDLLAADSSQYDATVNGSILATIMLYSIKPFYNSNYHEWFDRAIHILTFKHIILDSNLSQMWEEEYQDATAAAAFSDLYRPFELVSLTSGLISGAKFTHVGGSFYGEVVIHRGIPALLGYEARYAPQAGDDTLLAIPKSFIKDDVESTYGPIEEAAARFNIEINKSKQIWHVVQDEVIKVFLQESYHYNTDTYGIGSIFRPASAAFFSERNKGLSVAEQMMAEISRANQGYDNPFAEPVLEFWLNKEQFLGVLFQRHGVNAFNLLVESIGLELNELAQKIDVGSFSWGISKEQLESGNLPILPVMANASSKLSLNVSVNEVLKTLQVEERAELENYDPDLEESEDIFGD